MNAKSGSYQKRNPGCKAGYSSFNHLTCGGGPFWVHSPEEGLDGLTLVTLVTMSSLLSLFRNSTRSAGTSSARTPDKIALKRKIDRNLPTVTLLSHGTRPREVIITPIE